MARQHDPVEFVITRNPEIRVLFGDYDDALIQVLTGDRPCHYRAPEHRLWLFGRTFSHAVDDAFAEQATERGRSQASRLCALTDARDELQRELERARHRLLVELAVRRRLERELVSRDGYNRTRIKVERLSLDMARDLGREEPPK